MTDDAVRCGAMRFDWIFRETENENVTMMMMMMMSEAQ